MHVLNDLNQIPLIDLLFQLNQDLWKEILLVLNQFFFQYHLYF